MKCIHCGRDNTRKDRETTHRCCQCGSLFAFEPLTDTHKVTDGFFQHSLDAMSPNNGLHFTERQLWYEFNRRLARRQRWWPATLIVTGLAAAAMLFVFTEVGTLWRVLLPAIAGVTVGLSLYVSRLQNLRHPLVDFGHFQLTYLRPWIAAHGEIPKLVPARPPQYGLQTRPEPDVSSYSFDRALVVDSTPLAAMLVANNFHFEHNCAILSVDGFPQGRADRILSMLRANPQLTVYSLHDASPNGCRLPLVLREASWFPDRSVFVFDLGLMPRHVMGKRWPTSQVTPQSLSPEQLLRLTPAEAKWLSAGNVAELAHLRPAALLRSVYRGIGRSAAVTSREKDEKEAADTSSDGGGDVIIYRHGSSEPDGEAEGGDFAGDDFGDGGDAGGDAGADSFG